MKFVIVGAGYVGFSTAVLLSSKYEVSVVDTNSAIADFIEKKVAPFEDPLISDFFNEKNLRLSFSKSLSEAISDADYCILSLPTDFIESTGYFDTSIIEKYIEEITTLDSELKIIIKSTVPIGFTKSMKERYNNENIMFVPEFLREGNALEDNLFPSRLILGGNTELTNKVEHFIKKVTSKKNFETLHTSTSEAEAIKLFSNTFLAARVSFFNEVDSFALKEGMSAEKIIKGMSLDPRIGDFYNNPSFGYGGYCLPKDTRQTAALLNAKQSPLIQSITASNTKRKKIIAADILNSGAKTIGIYRLIMKAGSDNFRETALSDIIDELKKGGAKIIIHEPLLKNETYQSIQLINNFNDFINTADLIVANRIDSKLEDFTDKVYSRDIYSVD